MLLFLIGEVAVGSEVFDRKFRLWSDNNWGFEFQKFAVGANLEFARALALDLHHL